ncbi:hypothetical protein GGS23DRAFT_6516 [Durotheca rogersii]|uniref:uncharacterized protein n=1 Tax=Durotheca rogersii TaxID=419775 RepID=UPI002220EC21|nr:uncharacterized protein GGS23DRAFT_6516 [Durotheca rogersii]KAI5868003.1 hypothetical protein GGS23DRAFT_6516 [Durotheca rogersii]
MQMAVPTDPEYLAGGGIDRTWLVPGHALRISSSHHRHHRLRAAQPPLPPPLQWHTDGAVRREVEAHIYRHLHARRRHMCIVYTQDGLDSCKAARPVSIPFVLLDKHPSPSQASQASSQRLCAPIRPRHTSRIGVGSYTRPVDPSVASFPPLGLSPTGSSSCRLPPVSGSALVSQTLHDDLAQIPLRSNASPDCLSYTLCASARLSAPLPRPIASR